MMQKTGFARFLHKEEIVMTKKQQKMLARIVAAAVLFVGLFVWEHAGFFENLENK